MNLELKQGRTVTDQWGRDTTISVLISNGRPVALIHSQDKATHYSDDAVHEEHVIQSVDMKVPSKKIWDDDYIQQISCPSRSGLKVNGEHNADELLEAAVFNADETNGFYFVKFGEQGAALPADASDGFLKGAKEASTRFSRIIRSGKLTGKPRSY